MLSDHQGIMLEIDNRNIDGKPQQSDPTIHFQVRDQTSTLIIENYFELKVKIGQKLWNGGKSA